MVFGEMEMVDRIALYCTAHSVQEHAPDVPLGADGRHAAKHPG